VALEVPWRGTTSVRSAKRSDLLRLLIPTAALPSLTLHKATAGIWANPGKGPRLTVTMTVYAVVPLGSAVVLPDHQTYGTFSLPRQDIGGNLEVELIAKSWSQPPRIHGRNPALFLESSDDSPLHTVHQGDQQIILEGPGFFRFRGLYEIDYARDDPGPLEVMFSTRPAGNDLSATVQATLAPSVDRDKGASSNMVAEWHTN
jgi:hypothetical protein